MKGIIAFLNISFFLLIFGNILSGCKKGANSIYYGPKIISFYPNSDTAGGVVQITGTNFSPINSNDIVKFHGVSAIVVNATANNLTVVVPPISAGGPITVTVNNYTAYSDSNFIILPTHIGPRINSFSPLVTGIGYSVVISGVGFNSILGANIVRVNDTVVPVLSGSISQLSISISDGSTSGRISVTNSNNQLTGTSADSIIIKKLTVSTFAGTGTVGSNDGPRNMASFNGFNGIVADTNGNLFITDRNNNKIRKITPDGVVSTYTGTGASGSTDGPVTSATFSQPIGITIDQKGNLFVSEVNGDIREISSGGIVSTIVGQGTFSNPQGVAVDTGGNLFVVDNGTNTIKKNSPQETVTIIAGSGTAGSNDGTGAVASFNNSFGIAIDARGNLFVTEPGNSEIRKITPTGTVTTIAGNQLEQSSDGQGISASVETPTSAVFDQYGNLYFTEAYPCKIRIVTPSDYVSTLAGQEISAISIDGIGAAVQFANPYGITIDKNGILYVLDNQSNQVRKIVVQ